MKSERPVGRYKKNLHKYMTKQNLTSNHSLINNWMDDSHATNFRQQIKLIFSTLGTGYVHLSIHWQTASNASNLKKMKPPKAAKNTCEIRIWTLSLWFQHSRTKGFQLLGAIC